MKHLGEDVALGVGSFAAVSVVGVEDVVIKAIASMVIAALSSVVAHFVKKWLHRREYSKIAARMKERKAAGHVEPHP
jgi:hypothetical protein